MADKVGLLLYKNGVYNRGSWKGDYQSACDEVNEECVKLKPFFLHPTSEGGEGEWSFTDCKNILEEFTERELLENNVFINGLKYCVKNNIGANFV